MLTPAISIITPNYNKGQAAAACVESVKAQTAENWELIFIDDGSTDRSFTLAKDAAKGDPRIHFMQNATGTKGANAARNMGIEKSSAPLVFFLDSDDLITSNCIEARLSDFEQYPKMDMLIYPTGLFFDEIGDSALICNIPKQESDMHRFLRRDITWLISGPTWRKSALEQLGGFDLSLLSQQDYDLHVRALIKNLAYHYFHRTPDVYYRRNIDSVPRLTSHSIEHLRQRYNMVLRHHDMLLAENRLERAEKQLLACYILDLAQMMRWHIAKLGKQALEEALGMWEKARELQLVDMHVFKTGKEYVRFKHQMLYNRVPRFQARRELDFRKKLDGFIFYPSKTYCQVTLDDYAG